MKIKLTLASDKHENYAMTEILKIAQKGNQWRFAVEDFTTWLSLPTSKGLIFTSAQVVEKLKEFLKSRGEEL